MLANTSWNRAKLQRSGSSSGNTRAGPARGSTQGGRFGGQGGGREQAQRQEQESRKRSSGDASLESSPAKAELPPGRLLEYKPKGDDMGAKKKLELALMEGDNNLQLPVPPPPPKYIAPREKKRVKKGESMSLDAASTSNQAAFGSEDRQAQ